MVAGGRDRNAVDYPRCDTRTPNALRVLYSVSCLLPSLFKEAFAESMQRDRTPSPRTGGVGLRPSPPANHPDPDGVEDIIAFASHRGYSTALRSRPPATFWHPSGMLPLRGRRQKATNAIASLRGYRPSASTPG